MQLELLAPAKNKEIGIAAIDCGADSIYIAGPSFGAREAAGNSVEDIAELVKYAHRFGVQIFTVVNTIIYEDELASVEKLIWQLYDAKVDALIIQDLGLLKLNLPPIRLFASTQTFINNPDQARFLESLGFERLILERQMSLDQIRAVRSAVSCDLEFFVHGALCVSYSGQCYLSRCITGRSANRGECAQACRSRYDLVDADGTILLEDRSILSLKDYKLDNHIADLVDAGISSFKIEGRLKNVSYVKNVVRHYRNVIDDYLAQHPEHTKSSFGSINGGFTPDIYATFNRGYTDCFINGEKGQWSSADAAKSLGEFIGDIQRVQGNRVTINTAVELSNGDGLAFITSDNQVIGFRADVVQGTTVQIKDASKLSKGLKVYRNLNIKFERELEKSVPKRLINVEVEYSTANGKTVFKATAESGKRAEIAFDESAELATKKDQALASLSNQIDKISEPYIFHLGRMDYDNVYFYPASFINSIRRSLAAKLDEIDYESKKHKKVTRSSVAVHERLTYKANVSNSKAEELYREHGAKDIAKAYEIVAPASSEVMRTKYCIKFELGLCPKQNPTKRVLEPLYLLNKDYRLRLAFDCKNCEMVVIL